MSTTAPSRTASTPSESNTPRLDVPAMTRPILENYDAHVNNFIVFLRDRLGLHLVYQGPRDVHLHVLQRSVYACSLYYQPKKILKDVFPVMIGSSLDMAIRFRNAVAFREPLDLLSFRDYPFQELDVARGFFIVNGFVRQVPYFYTNDPTNTHVVQNKIVRVYSYSALDRGKELSYHVSGEVVVVNNDGTATSSDPGFFAHCPHPVDFAAYMEAVYRDELFDIDHLGNKIVVSPGHLFTKLFVKYLYGPLREGNWKAIKSKASLVTHSIETGYLLHVLSRKTLYFKEGKSAGKMTKEPHHSHREIGANGEVFVEKNMGCYREISTQTYPLNPFLLYVVVRQVSKKVKSIESFHDSYTGYFCILGCFETKNVGRTTMMVRETVVSTADLLDPVYHEDFSEFWDTLDLEPSRAAGGYYVVVNEACVSVTRKSFESVDLLRIKRKYGRIECLQRKNFKVIRFKPGLIMKRLPGSDLYVTPYDQLYWTNRLFDVHTQKRMVELWGFPFITGFMVDLNPWFNHTAFPKIILAFNALKNAVLATDRRIVLYFMDSVSAYLVPSDRREVVLAPADDGWSEHFAMQMPRVNVAYMSFRGCTQEDCIVKSSGCRAFDCVRFYTIRCKFTTTAAATAKFHPVKGDVDDGSDLLGTFVSESELEVVPYSIHVKAVRVSPCEYRIHFAKHPFRLVHHAVADGHLMVSVEQDRVCSTGDKLCSLHGQKGVIRVMDDLPEFPGTEKLDLVVNPYCMFRMTPGQIREACAAGGRDFVSKNGILAFIGRSYYFAIAYYANEHLYAPRNCVIDILLQQAVKGRSRQGGMKLGGMELNALRANGVAACSEQKLFEDGDRVAFRDDDGLAAPQSVRLVKEDAKFYKCKFEFQTVPSIREDRGWRARRENEICKRKRRKPFTEW